MLLIFWVMFALSLFWVSGGIWILLGLCQFVGEYSGTKFTSYQLVGLSTSIDQVSSIRANETVSSSLPPAHSAQGQPKVCSFPSSFLPPVLPPSLPSLAKSSGPSVERNTPPYKSAEVYQSGNRNFAGSQLSSKTSVRESTGFTANPPNSPREASQLMKLWGLESACKRQRNRAPLITPVSVL